MFGDSQVVKTVSTTYTPPSTKSSTVSVTDFGADPTGNKDSSSAFTAALASATCVTVPPGNYKVKNVNVNNGRTLLAYGAYIFDLPGANYVFKLTDYASKIVGAYISSALNCTVAAIVVDDGMACEISSVRILNATTGIQVSTLTGNCARLQILDVYVIAYSKTGLFIGPNANEINAVNLYLDSNSVASVVQPTLATPKPNTYGIHHEPGVSVMAVGGHMFVNVTCINMQTGVFLDGGQLTKFSNLISDSVSGVGVKLKDATNIDFDGLFIGTAGRALEISGASRDIQIASMKTIFTNLIPTSWGASDFFTSSGVTPGNDLYVTDSAFVSINAAGWVGSTRNIYQSPTATVNYLGGETISLNSVVDVAAGSTAFLLNQFTSELYTESILYTAPFAEYTADMIFTSGLAPGTGNTFTYTLRVNNADSTMTARIADNSTQSSLTGTRIRIEKGQKLSVKLVTSAGATTTTHTGYLLLIPNT